MNALLFTTCVSSGASLQRNSLPRSDSFLWRGSKKTEEKAKQTQHRGAGHRKHLNTSHEKPPSPLFSLEFSERGSRRV